MGSSRKLLVVSNESPVPPEAQTNAPFLTEEQKIAIHDAIILKRSRYRQMKLRGVRRGLSKGQMQLDRHSRMAKGSGAPKKGGLGGKFTWGDPLTNMEDTIGVLDEGDPNYDSTEDGATLLHQEYSERVRQFKAFVSDCISEYFEAGDIAEVSELLSEANMPRLMHHFVKRAIVMSLDRKDREREMVSVLLSALYGDVLAMADVEKGFVSIIKTLDDTSLDVPDAPAMVSKFIARAVVDEILPPATLQKLFAAAQTDAAQASVNEADVLLHGRHSAEQVLRCWGNGAGLTLDETKASLLALLDEFQVSKDVKEAERRLRELSVPFFHHELVRRAIQRMVSSDAASETMGSLLKALHGIGLMSDTQMSKGFQRQAEMIEEEELDKPGAKADFQKVIDKAQSEGWLDPHFSIEAALTEARASAVEVDPREQAYKSQVETVIREFFESKDVDEVARCLGELSDVSLRHLFVKRLLTMALDRKNRHREMASSLMATLYPETIPQAALMGGFEAVIDSIDDLTLDVPDAPNLIALFLSRAVVDELLAPAFLQSVLHMLPDGHMGVEVVNASASILSKAHAAQVLERCWSEDASANGA